MRLIVVAILLTIMVSLKYFTGIYDDHSFHSVILSFGFLIFFGYTAGCYSLMIGLPQITGYLLAGIVCGPYLLNFISVDDITNLKLIDDLALVLIAFTAGGELKINHLKKSLKGIISISLFQSISVFLIVSLGVYVLIDYFDVINISKQATLVAAIMSGVIAMANSPATAIAVIVETHSKGKVTDTVIGVTVLKDVFVMLGFAASLAIAFALLKADQNSEGIIINILSEIGLSFFVGILVAGIVAIYLKYIIQEFVLFVIALAILIVFISQYIHFHFILACMFSGFLVENFTNLGDKLLKAIERTSMTVYIIFFSIAGAAIDFHSLKSMWILAILFVLLRLIGIGFGTVGGALLTKESKITTQYGFLGFIAQAGVSLGMASIVARAFPEWGNILYTIVISAIAINQLIGPVAFKILLNLAGETSKSHIIKGVKG